MTPMTVVMAAESESGEIGPGSLGFWILILMIAALVVLYRSMRKQIRRVDFDANGLTDEERMHGRHHTSG